MGYLIRSQLVASGEARAEFTKAHPSLLKTSVKRQLFRLVITFFSLRALQPIVCLLFLLCISLPI